MNQTFYALFAIGAGCCIALQAPANNKLRMHLGENALVATFASICGTFVTVLIALAVLRPAAPSMEGLRQTQWWNWIGGPLGALFVLAGSSLISRLGAGLYVALVVSAQLFCSLLLDHYGLMSVPQQSITPTRILGAALVVAGVVCIKYL